MVEASRDFQVFVKPTGALCNLGCTYCYYLDKEKLYSYEGDLKMSDTVLEKYIVQHLEACPEDVVIFSWHGGEPTILGLDYYRKIVELQDKHRKDGQTIVNGIQTNGTLLDDDWCRFLASEGFAVGLSMDGPREMHDRYRLTKDLKPTFKDTLRGYKLLQKYGVYTEILCVVNSNNVKYPLEVYDFFMSLKCRYLTFLPLVDKMPKGKQGVTSISIRSGDWGRFLCKIFDEWKEKGIGRIKIQIFEEAIRTAFDQEHSLCIFRPTCGDVPVVEHNGDFYSCDHFVDPEHLIGNIMKNHLGELLDSSAQRGFGRAKLETLPSYCLECEVEDMCNGGCPKNRFIETPYGEPGLNYLCEGYKQFFTHCKPFVKQVAKLRKKG